LKGERRRVAPQPHHDIDRFRHGGADRADLLGRREPRRVENVGTGRFVGLEPADRVVEIRPAVQKVLRPSDEHELEGERPGRFDRRREPIDGLGDFVDGVFGIARRVLDRAADEAGSRREPDRLRDVVRRAAVAALEVRGHRKIGRLHDLAGVLERFRAPDRAVAPPEREGEARARRRQRLEAEMGQDLRGAGVERIRNDEGPRSLVEELETRGFFRLRAHVGEFYSGAGGGRPPGR